MSNLPPRNKRLRVSDVLDLINGDDSDLGESDSGDELSEEEFLPPAFDTDHDTSDEEDDINSTTATVDFNKPSTTSARDDVSAGTPSTSTKTHVKAKNNFQWLQRSFQPPSALFQEEMETVDDIGTPFSYGVEPKDSARRWDKSVKDFRQVERPLIVKLYNEKMGGVDQLDAFCSKYRFNLRSKRWYMTIFWYFVKIALVNSWLLYKRHCRVLRTPQKEILQQKKFQASVATSLIQLNATGRKRGRLSLDDQVQKGTPRKMAKAPPMDVVKDKYAHWPISGSRGRCTYCKTQWTDAFCEKCNMRLCFNSKRNCFKSFHI